MLIPRRPAPSPAPGCATDDARTDRRRRRSSSPTPAKSRQTDSMERSRTVRACSCQIEQNEQRNGHPRAVSISHTGRCARHAYCLRQPSDMMARRQRHVVEHIACRSRRGVHDARRRAAQRQPGTRGQRTAAFERVAQPRQHQLAVVDHDRADFRREERSGIRRCGVAADDDRDAGDDRAHTRGQRQHVVGFERVHRGDADQTGAHARDVVLERALNRKSASVTS